MLSLVAQTEEKQTIGNTSAEVEKPGAVSKTPNVVVILVDDMGYGDIAPFGSKINPTPNLEQLAKEGMKLTSFYCAPVCSASRAQLLTGCYSKRAGVPDVLFPGNANGLNPAEKTIADLLKPLGYSTMCIGKWHLGDQPIYLPTNHGFDHYLGLPYSNDMGGDGKADKKGNIKPPLPLVQDLKVIKAPIQGEEVTKIYTEAAVKFIQENKEKPFFLYMPHTAIHNPFTPGSEFAGKSGKGPYCDWIIEMDWSVGEVIKTLKELKLDQNTIVIFTSDNGSICKDSGSNAPFRGTKFSTWEGGMREPAIVWWPGKIPAGSTSDVMLSQIDIMPTVLKLAGGVVPPERKIDGLDIWPVLSGQSKESPHEVLYFWYWHELQALRSGPWKMAIVPQKGGDEAEEEEGGAKKKGKVPDIAASREQPRLYNLDLDNGEKNDVAAENPEVVKRMLGYVTVMEGDLGLMKGSKKQPAGPGARHYDGVENPKLLIKDPHEFD